MALGCAVPVAESDFRDFSKNLHKNTGPQNVELSKNFDRIIEAFIETAGNPEITSGHRAAATNGICSLIEHMQRKCAVRPLDKNRWFEIFSIFLDRSDTAKGKSMRQLLGVLLNYLSTLDIAESTAIKKETLNLLIQTLHAQSDHVKVKPAFQALSTLFSRQIVSVKDILQLLPQQLSQNLDGTTTALSNGLVLKNFIRTTLGWARHQEVALAAGQALCIFLKFLSQSPEMEAVSLLSISTTEPLWAEPLIGVVEEFPDAINAFRNHLFPDLFRLDLFHYVQFLEKLGLHHRLAISRRLPTLTEYYKDSTNSVLYTALQVGKEIGIVIDFASTSADSIKIQGNALYIPDKALCPLMKDQSSAVRLAGLSLVVSSALITRPFTEGSLGSLKISLPHLFLETDANIRGEVLTLMQRMIDRIKAVSSSLKRTVNHEGKTLSARNLSSGVHVRMQSDNKEPEVVLESHQRFMRWFVQFLNSQLHPSATYQRHITALRALLILGKCGYDDHVDTKFLSKQALGEVKWSFNGRICNSGTIRGLHDLVMNPFDDVRNFSAILLEILLQPSQNALMTSNISLREERSAFLKFISTAEKRMLRTGRADHADGVSRTYGLLFVTALEESVDLQRMDGCCPWWCSKLRIVAHLVDQLESTIVTATESLSRAVGKSPMHGILASLRYILDSPGFYKHIASGNDSARVLWVNLHYRLTEALQNVWACVRGILCNDAPEGYVPKEMEDNICITTKDILSYSWRALKEASSLLRSIVTNTPIDDSATDSILHYRDLENLSVLCFTELTELRHRGAFSAVAQAFAACCSRARSLNQLVFLDKLYQDILLCVRNKGSTTTRRSAGLPSLMTGMLGAYTDSSVLGQAMKDLMLETKTSADVVAVHGDPLPQVHALNCLRAIFISTILGPSSEPYIIPALNIAGSCLTSQIWAIRNCGLMLFRALIDRLLGSTDSQNWSEDGHMKAARLSYNDYPSLLEIVIELLTPGPARLISADGALESVFPALKIIQRIPPPINKRKEIRDLVLKLCENPHWHVRDMAARTFSGLVPKSELLDVVDLLLPHLQMNQNKIHGRLLCISQLVKLELRDSKNGIPETLVRIARLLRSHYPVLYEFNPCPFTRAAFLDLLNQFDIAALAASDTQVSFKKTQQDQFCQQVEGHQSGLLLTTKDIKDILLEPPGARRALILHFSLHWLNYMAQMNGSGETDQAGRLSVCLYDCFCELERKDAMALSEVFRALIEVASSLSPHSLHMLSRILSRIANGSKDIRLMSDAREMLATLYDALGKDDRLFWEPLTPKSMRITLSHSKFPPPSLLENTLLLWGPLVDEACRQEPSRYVLVEELERMFCALQPLTHESRPFDIRYSVAACLHSVSSIWRMGLADHDLTSIRLKAILLAYDIMNDDDDEIRDIGCSVAKDILASVHRQNARDTAVPLVASRQLAFHLSQNYRTSKQLCTEAVRRMTGSTIINNSLVPSAQQRLDDATAENTALFAIEKQNLYIDEINEAQLWSEVLKRLSLKAIPSSARSSLSFWVQVGLMSLFRKAQSEHDGPLGWSSNPDVFILGMQIFCSASVLLNWRTRTRKLPIPGFEIRRMLVSLLDAGRKSDLHEAWLGKIESVLTESVRGRIFTIGRKLANLENELAFEGER